MLSTEQLRLLFQFPVLTQAFIALGSIAMVVGLIAETGWEWRYLVYSYQVGLLVLYAHFFCFGPVLLLGSPGNILYWAAMLGTTPANIAPWCFEWPYVVRLWNRRARPLTFRAFILGAWVTSALWTAIAYWWLRIAV